MIKIYRQYQIINGYVQLPPNIIRTTSKPTDKNAATWATVLNSPDATSIQDMRFRHKAGNRWLEFLDVTVGD